MSNAELQKAARRLAVLQNPHAAPPPAQPRPAPVAPPANPPGGAPASVFNARAAVEKLAKSTDGRDHVLARLAILNHTTEYIDSFAAGAAPAPPVARTAADELAAALTALGASSIEEARAKLGIPAPAAAPAAPPPVAPTK